MVLCNAANKAEWSFSILPWNLVSCRLWGVSPLTICWSNASSYTNDVPSCNGTRSLCFTDLTHCGMATPCGDIDLWDLCHHWIRWWPDVWRHRISYYINICWFIVHLLFAIHMKTISQQMLKMSVSEMNLNIVQSNLRPHLPEAIELNHWGRVMHICGSKQCHHWFR